MKSGYVGRRHYNAAIGIIMLAWTTPATAQFNFPARATVAAPGYLNNQYVLLSTDLAGNLRVIGTFALGAGTAHLGRVTVDSILANMTHIGAVRVDTLPALVMSAGNNHIGRVAVDSILANQTHIGRVAVDSILANQTHIGRVAVDSILANQTHIGRVAVDSILANQTHIGRTAVDTLFAASNPIAAGLVDQPASRATATIGTREIPENYTGVYSFALVDAAGVAAANRFLCLFNLAGSNDTVTVLAARVDGYSVGVSAAKNSISLTRVTACTVGTLQAAATVNKMVSAYANAASEVRTGNPTVTAVANVAAWGPNQAITAAGTTAAGSGSTWVPYERMTLVPGEGVVLYQTVAGDVDETYNFQITWAERQH